MIGEKLCLENSGKAESIAIGVDKLEITSWRTIWARSWRMGKAWLQKWENVTEHGKPWALPLWSLSSGHLPTSLRVKSVHLRPRLNLLWRNLYGSDLPRFAGGSEDKELACNMGELGSSPALRRSPGEGNGNPVQYTCLENSMTEEPGELQSMGLQRVRHNWATNTHTHTKAPDAQPGMKTQLWGAGEGNETGDGRLWASFSSSPYLLPKISLF